jgi:hypothetical protein
MCSWQTRQARQSKSAKNDAQRHLGVRQLAAAFYDGSHGAITAREASFAPAWREPFVSQDKQAPALL